MSTAMLRRTARLNQQYWDRYDHDREKLHAALVDLIRAARRDLTPAELELLDGLEAFSADYRARKARGEELPESLSLTLEQEQVIERAVEAIQKHWRGHVEVVALGRCLLTLSKDGTGMWHEMGFQGIEAEKGKGSRDRKDRA